MTHDTSVASANSTFAWLSVRPGVAQVIAIFKADGEKARTQRDAVTAFGVRCAQRGTALPFAGRACPLDGLQRVRHLRLRLDLGARGSAVSPISASASPPSASIPHYRETGDFAHLRGLIRGSRRRLYRCRRTLIAALGIAVLWLFKPLEDALHAAGLSRARLRPALRADAGAGRHRQGLRVDGRFAGAALHPAAAAAAARHGGGALCRPADGGDDGSGRGDCRHLGGGSRADADHQPAASGGRPFRRAGLRVQGVDPAPPCRCSS